MNKATVIIFGATGDLTHLKLVPALFELYKNGTQCEIIGFGRRGYSTESFRDTFVPTNQDQELWNAFLQTIQYFDGDFQDTNVFRQLKEQIHSDNVLFYLATAPQAFEGIIQNIGNVALNNDTSRIVIEKPFGEDKQSALQLYNTLHSVFNDDKIFIIDHYLGKETLQNIFAFRFANGIFEPIWNRNYIESIQITLAENFGIGKRGGYYEQAGNLKDMLQNHALQILAALTMEQPESLQPKDIHISRAHMMQALHIATNEDLEKYFVRGQYEGYKQEENVDQNSSTETFAAIKTHIHNDRFEGVPIYIRSGKMLPLKVTEGYIEFKKPINNLFTSNQHVCNRLAFRIQSNEGISLTMQLKEPGKEMNLKDVSMDFCYKDVFNFSDNSYVRLLGDAINGDMSLFTSIDEIIAGWDFITPYVTYAREHPEQTYSYTQQSWGPQQAQELVVWDTLYPYKCDVNISV